LQSLVHLNNRCLPDILQDIVSHGAHDPEEFPFLEEMHVLRRLQVRFRPIFMGHMTQKSYPAGITVYIANRF
jgi:hypothetical protein